MSSFAPAASYHAELREQLGSLGRALVLQRLATWAARGLLAGLLLDLGLTAWAWTREAVSALPLALLVFAPLAGAALAGLATLVPRRGPPELARRVDRAAGLQERSVTALELGTRGAEHPLALAQMRDAVEHLRRLDALETFPLRAPRVELVAAVGVAALAAMVAFAPNPWLVRARAANPAIAVAREQAQRVERLAESLQAEDTADLQQLRDLLRRGARTVDARSNEPEAALGALEDLEQRLRELSAGDDELAAALAAIASALAADPSTSQLASAINTGDLREVARASRDLAQRTEQMDGQERARVARTLRDAANRAGRASPALASQLGQAADALQGSAGAEPGAAGAEQGAGGGRQGAAQEDQSAAGTLDELANSAAGAAERQRAQNQLEASRNALERALGRGQSRSGASSGRSSAGQRSPSQPPGASGAEQSGAQDGQAEQGESGGSGDPAGGSQDGGEPGQGQPGGSGYGTGTLNRTGPGVSELDTITRAEQDTSGAFRPDETTSNPYLGEAGQADVRSGEEQVRPSFARGSTQSGGDTSSIPLGLRDLVKDYFSGLDQK